MNVREDFNKYLIDTYDPVNFVPVRGIGSKLYNEDGEEVIDFSGGIAVNCLGHADPRLIQALTFQAQKLWHASNIMTNQPVVELAKRLVNSTCFDRAFVCNSGTEAVEAGLKLSRRYATQKYGKEKHQIVSFANSFHGRTLFAVATGGQAKYSQDYTPLPAGISHGQFNDIQSAKELINGNTAVVITELVQAEGGVIPAEKAFLAALRELCNQNNAILMYDEVQTGVGRSGKLFAYQHYLGCEPDLISVAKGLGGGFPIGAILIKEPYPDGFAIGSHGTTFGGNPLAAAVANTVLDIVNDPEFLRGVTTRSTLLKTHLKLLNDELNLFTEIRGSGLLIGAVLTDEYKGQAKEIVKTAFRHGVAILTASPDVIRFTPALNISDEDIAQGIERLSWALRENKDALKR